MSASTELISNHTVEPPPDHWREVIASTYIENWPKSLHELSIPSCGLPLGEREIHAFGSCIAEWGELFSDLEDASATRRLIVQELDQAVMKFPAGVFVRLGSRGPKDTIFPASYRLENGKLKSGREAWNMLTAGSERIAKDLQVSLAKDYQPWIWVREGVNIPKWTEFRCFMRDRRLVGISQYHYSGLFLQVADHAAEIRDSIVEFFTKKFVAACHLDSVVLDVFVSPQKGGFFETRLLEINPFDSLLTDACLFKWDEIERVAKGVFRFRDLS
jgi:hypothetical protein